MAQLQSEIGPIVVRCNTVFSAIEIDIAETLDKWIVDGGLHYDDPRTPDIYRRCFRDQMQVPFAGISTSQECIEPYRALSGMAGIPDA